MTGNSKVHLLHIQMQIESTTKQRLPHHVYTRKSNNEERQNVTLLIKRTMTRGLCRHRTALAKGPKPPILVCRLQHTEKCERDVKNTEEPVAFFCRFVARRPLLDRAARGKRVSSLKNRRENLFQD